jgi:hypothetical protein
MGLGNPSLLFRAKPGSQGPAPGRKKQNLANPDEYCAHAPQLGPRAWRAQGLFLVMTLSLDDTQAQPPRSAEE